MRIITDWHLHSRFSRACSKDLTLENNALWCAKKGVDVLGTADFTHPAWFSEIQSKLEEAEPGLYKLRIPLTSPLGKGGDSTGTSPNPSLERRGVSEIRFMMTTEVAQIYKKDGKVRRIHNIIMAPSIEAVGKINKWLTEQGFNLKADGRPILGIDSELLYRQLKDINERIIVIPAHAWTPWFSVFGSKSGFDSIEECFGEMTPYIYAIETGLSSDPLMNRQLSALDNVMLISNSDAHSPRNFGREANVFEMDRSELSYDEFVRILRERDTSKFAYTIEFYPEEGKYHTDGHSNCNFWCAPEVTKKHGGRCPKCGKLITVGVLSRVQDLADRDAHEMPSGHVPYKSIVPLQELIAESFGVKSTSSKRVQAMYEKMIAQIGNEFSILLDESIEHIGDRSTPAVAEAVRRMRAGELNIRPGFDGIFGEVHIYSEDDPPPVAAQEKLVK
ncbi:MAG: endonuclease Q family protein [Candidatus Uhrbacteria bacterium]|nr:endonuclease Q family protein [Candidatus Uhrbacteria bacterium]